MGDEENVHISPGQAAGVIDQLVDDLCALPVDFSDSPLLPEKIAATEADEIAAVVALAGRGEYQQARALLDEGGLVGFEPEYLRGKILFATGEYCDASDCFVRAALLFDGYGELWFLLGIVNHQLGLRADAGMFWKLALKCNDQHQDARILFTLFEQVMYAGERRINPESYIMQPLVEGKGIDVGCGSAKTHADAIGVDLIAPGAVGEEASQKGEVSQADIQASGDHLTMFPDDDLDYVIARHNLEHYDDPVRALKEWLRVLKPGGVIGLVLPDDDAFDTMAADPTHKTPFTRDSLQEMVSGIDGLELIAAGDAIFAWSFYAIIQKQGESEKAPPYPYWARLNALAAADAQSRIKRGEALDNPLLLREASKKKEQLLAATKKSEALRCALVREGDALSAAPAAPLTTLGVALSEIPLDSKGGVRWLGEKTLREKGIDLIVNLRCDPPFVRSVALLPLPVLCRIGAAGERETTVASDIDYSRCHIVTASSWLHDRFVAAGATHVTTLPESADDDAFGVEIIFERERPLVRPWVEWEDDFFQLRSRIVNRLADGEMGVEDKNTLLRLWRRVGEALRHDDEESLRDIFNVDKWLGVGHNLVHCGVHRERRGSSIRKVVKAIAATSAVVESCAELPGLMAQSGGLLMFQPPFAGGAIEQSFFNAMAAGACVMVPASEAISSLYHSGEELLCFHTPEEGRELWEKTTPEKRRSIGEAARRATLERHSQAARWREILAWAGYEQP